MEKKRKAKLIATLSLIVITIAIMTMPAAAYTIDGDLSDWGVDLTGNWSLNDTWVPNSGVEFIVEDNADPRWDATYNGVHIQGTGSNYTRYYEDQVYCTHYGKYMTEPIGGEYYDIEAKYFDEDSDYIYIAMVTSMDPDGEGDPEPGDFSLDLDGDDSTGEYGYEYGVALHTSGTVQQWNITYLPDWAQPYYCEENAPGKILGLGTGGYYNGTANGAYFRNATYPPDDQGEPNWVIEMAIPKDKVGMAGKSLKDDEPFPKALYACDTCGNDKIKNSIPEFLTIAIPVGAILGLIYVHRRKRQGKVEREE